MDDLKLYNESEKEPDALSHTVRVFSQYRGMVSGIEKCSTFMMKKKKNLKPQYIGFRHVTTESYNLVELSEAD